MPRTNDFERLVVAAGIAAAQGNHAVAEGNLKAASAMVAASETGLCAKCSKRRDEQLAALREARQLNGLDEQHAVERTPA